MRISFNHFIIISILFLLLCVKSSAIDKEDENYGITHKIIFNNSDNCTLCHMYNNFSSAVNKTKGDPESSQVKADDEYEYEDKEDVGEGLSWFFGKKKKKPKQGELGSYVSSSYNLSGFVNREDIIPHEFIKQITGMCVSSKCHTDEELGPSHIVDISPYDAYPDMVVPKEIPLNWDTVKYKEVMTCGTCHNPHLDWLSTTRSYDIQKPEKKERGRAYYKTYYLRIKDPQEGYYTLCKSCHEEGY
jgi:nitrate/TMAO reductase-like tetraheme cytochrome c subunit